MKRVSALIYGIICYLIFFTSSLWLILFIDGFEALVPTTVNSGTVLSMPWALLIDIGLILLFGLQHSIMARKSFKTKWTTIVSKPLERSTYVLFSSIALILMIWFWQPMTGIVWEVQANWAQIVLQVGFWLGWAILFLATFMIDHFELFGLRQVYNYLRGKEHKPPHFMEPGFYKLIRHPLMLGFLIAFWSRPTVTTGHLIFSIGMTSYILIGVYFEEKTMIQNFGEKYKDYRSRVPKFIPGLKTKS